MKSENRCSGWKRADCLFGYAVNRYTSISDRVTVQRALAVTTSHHQTKRTEIMNDTTLNMLKWRLEQVQSGRLTIPIFSLSLSHQSHLATTSVSQSSCWCQSLKLFCCRQLSFQYQIDVASGLHHKQKHTKKLTFYEKQLHKCISITIVHVCLRWYWSDQMSPVASGAKLYRRSHNRSLLYCTNMVMVARWCQIIYVEKAILSF